MKVRELLEKLTDHIVNNKVDLDSEVEIVHYKNIDKTNHMAKSYDDFNDHYEVYDENVKVFVIQAVSKKVKLEN